MINKNNLLSELLSNNSIKLIDINSKTSLKTSKQKLLFSINKEINILKIRENLELIKTKYFSEKHNKTLVKIENRFWKNSINNTISFNLKCKGEIVNIDGVNNKNQNFSCENNKQTLIDSLKHFYSVIEKLDNNNLIFNQIK